MQHEEGTTTYTFLHVHSTVKDKAQHAVIMDKTVGDKLTKDVPTYRLITVAVLVDRLKINGSLARRAIADLEEKGLIKPVVKHARCGVWGTLSLLLHITNMTNIF